MTPPLRTIRCYAVYRPARRSIVMGFRTKAELKRHYSSGIPVGCVVVEMKGHYFPDRVRPKGSTSTATTNDKR